MQTFSCAKSTRAKPFKTIISTASIKIKKLMDVKKRYNYVKYLLKKLRVNNYYVKRKGNCFQRNFLKIKPIPIR